MRMSVRASCLEARSVLALLVADAHETRVVRYPEPPPLQISTAAADAHANDEPEASAARTGAAVALFQKLRCARFASGMSDDDVLREAERGLDVALRGVIHHHAVRFPLEKQAHVCAANGCGLQFTLWKSLRQHAMKIHPDIDLGEKVDRNSTLRAADWRSVLDATVALPQRGGDRGDRDGDTSGARFHAAALDRARAALCMRYDAPHSDSAARAVLAREARAAPVPFSTRRRGVLGGRGPRNACATCPRNHSCACECRARARVAASVAAAESPPAATTVPEPSGGARVPDALFWWVEARAARLAREEHRGCLWRLLDATAVTALALIMCEHVAQWEERDVFECMSLKELRCACVERGWRWCCELDAPRLRAALCDNVAPPRLQQVKRERAPMEALRHAQKRARSSSRTQSGSDNEKELLASVARRAEWNAARSSQYCGVAWHASKLRWEAKLSVGGVSHSLGYFGTESAAAAAYDAELQRRGLKRMRVRSTATADAAPRKRASHFRGVSWSTSKQRWRSTISYGGEGFIREVHLGFFDDERSAAEAYDREVLSSADGQGYHTRALNVLSRAQGVLTRNQKKFTRTRVGGGGGGEDREKTKKTKTETTHVSSWNAFVHEEYDGVRREHPDFDRFAAMHEVAVRYKALESAALESTDRFSRARDARRAAAASDRRDARCAGDARRAASRRGSVSKQLLVRTAYRFFVDEHYDAERMSLPGRPMSDVARALGARWKALSATERAPFEALNVADFLRIRRVEAERRLCAVDIERTTPRDALRFLRDTRCDMSVRTKYGKLPVAMRKCRRRWAREMVDAEPIEVPGRRLSAGTIEDELLSVDVERVTVREVRSLLQRLQQRARGETDEEEEEEDEEEESEEESEKEARRDLCRSSM